jgi:hypothetical protein
VNLYSDGVVAILDNGEKVLIQPGIQVREAGGEEEEKKKEDVLDPHNA